MASTKRPGRPTNGGVLVRVRLPRDTYRELHRMARQGRFGSTDAEVAEYLVKRGIDDWQRDGVIQPMSANEKLADDK